MLFSELRAIAKERVAALAPSVPGVEFTVSDDAMVIPDTDSDGFGAYVTVTATGGERVFETMLYIESSDGQEATDDADAELE